MSYDGEELFVVGGNTYGEGNMLYIEDDDDKPQTPTERHGMMLGVCVFIGIIFLTIVVTAVVMYCNKRQEAFVRNRKQAKADKMEDSLRNNVCKSWGGDMNDDRSQQETVRTVDDLPNGADSSDSSFSSDSSLEGSVDEEQGLEAKAPSHGCKDGSVCAICSEEYGEGQPVYESNNPQCGHQFHKKCMDKWLDIQHTCPVCNQAFALRTV